MHVLASSATSTLIAWYASLVRPCSVFFRQVNREQKLGARVVPSKVWHPGEAQGTRHNEALEASLARSPRLDSCGRKCRERWHGVLCWHRFVESHPKEFLCVSLTWLIELIASYPSYSFTDQDEEQVSESRWNDFLKLVNSFLHAHRCVSGTDWKAHEAHMYDIATLCHIVSTFSRAFRWTRRSLLPDCICRGALS